MQARAKKMHKASPQEQETFAAEMARQMPNETDFNVRLAMVNLLAKMETPSANAVLYAGMKDPEADIRVTCCQAWTNKPSPETTHMLAEVLSSDTNLDVRHGGGEGASHAHDKEAVAALGQALDDSDPGLRYCVMESLRYVTGKRSIGDDVEKWREIAKQPDPPIGNQRLQRQTPLWMATTFSSGVSCCAIPNWPRGKCFGPIAFAKPTPQYYKNGKDREAGRAGGLAHLAQQFLQPDLPRRARPS